MFTITSRGFVKYFSVTKTPRIIKSKPLVNHICASFPIFTKIRSIIKNLIINKAPAKRIKYTRFLILFVFIPYFIYYLPIVQRPFVLFLHCYSVYVFQVFYFENLYLQFVLMFYRQYSHKSVSLRIKISL